MKRPFFFLAIFLIILILASRFFIKEGTFFPGNISHFTSPKGRSLAIKGTVINEPFYRHLYFRETEVFLVSPALVKVSKRWFPAHGNIRVTSYSDKKVKYGDEILFEATVKVPFSKDDSRFNYRQYLQRSGIYVLATISEKDPLIVTGQAETSRIKNFAYKIKGLLRRNIKKLFRAPERHFLSAVLLGERQDVPREWRDIFTKTQTMHLLAISGLHVGIIAFIVLFFVGLFGTPPHFKYILTILILMLYAVMVGARPSVVRATIMGAVLLASYPAKRDADIYNSLGLAAVVILIYNPEQLLDYGFILSFISVLSIIYITPRLNRIFSFDRINRGTYGGRALYYFSTLFSASCAVWLGILPLAVNFFNIASPVSVIANIFAIPLLFVILALSIVSLIFGLIFPFLGAVFAESAQFFIAILISSLRLFSRLPFAYFEAESQNILMVSLYYVALLGIIEYSRRH